MAGASPKTRLMPGRRLWWRELANKRGEAEAGRVITLAQARYDDLYAARARHDNRALRAHLENDILPGLALYRALQADGLDQEAALAEAEHLIGLPVACKRRQMAWLARLPFFFWMMRLVLPLQMKQGYPVQGWETEWVEKDTDSLGFNIHRCFYLDTLTAHGAPELTACFCRTDDVLLEDLSPYMRWERAQTLGRGGAYCDFRFRRVRRPRVQRGG